MAQRVRAPKTEQVITLLTTADKTKLDKVCEVNQLSTSEMVRDIVREYLSRCDEDGHVYNRTLI